MLKVEVFARLVFFYFFLKLLLKYLLFLQYNVILDFFYFSLEMLPSIHTLQAFQTKASSRVQAFRSSS